MEKSPLTENEAPTPSPAKPPRKGRRRWRRRLATLLGLLLLSAAGVYWLRAPIIEFAIDHFATGPIEERIGLPVRWSTSRYEETADGLVVRFFGLAVGRDPELTIEAESVTIRLGGWRRLFDGVEAVDRIEAESMVVTIPDPPPRPPEIPVLEIPAPLPEFPFPIVARDVEIRARGWAFRGDVTVEPSALAGRFSISPEIPCGPLGTIDHITFKARPAASGVEALEIVASPASIELGGRLAREGAEYRGTFELTLPRGEGELDLSLPVAASTSEPELAPSPEASGESPPTPRPRLAARLELAPPAELFEDFSGLFAETSGWQPDDWGLDLSRLDATELDLVWWVEPDPDPSRRRLVVTQRLQFGNARIDANGSLDPGRIDLEVDLRDLPVADWQIDAIRPYSPTGLLTAHSRLQGDWSSVGLEADLAWRDGSVVIAGETLACESLTVQVAWPEVGRDPASLSVEQLEARLLEGVVTGSGDLTKGLVLTTEGVELVLLRPWLPFLREATGRVSATATTRIVDDEWTYSLQSRLEDGELVFRDWNARFRRTNVGIDLEPGRLALNDLSTELRGGTIRGSGSIGWGANGIEEVGASAQVERVQFVRNSDLRVRASGELSLEGPWSAPHLRGAVTIDRGVYDRNYYPKITSGNSLPFDLFSFEEPFLARLGLNVTVRPQGKLLIRNNVIEVSPYGRLTLGGTGRQPVLTGDLTATAGTVRLPHVRLTIQRAAVRFPDDDPFRPQLEFSGEGSVGGYTVSCIAEGPLEAPRASFTSDPYLPDEDVLLLVATGYQRAQLEDERIEQIAAIEVLKLYGPQVWEQIFGRSADRTLLDDITITTTPGETNDVVRVELRLSDVFSVQGELDERGDLNVDLKASQWMDP